MSLFVQKCSRGRKAALFGAPSTSPTELQQFRTSDRSDHFTDHTDRFSDLHHLCKSPRGWYTGSEISVHFSAWSEVYAWSIPRPQPTDLYDLGQADHDLSERVKKCSMSIFVHRDHLWRATSLGEAWPTFFNQITLARLYKNMPSGGLQLPAMANTKTRLPSSLNTTDRPTQ